MTSKGNLVLTEGQLQEDLHKCRQKVPSVVPNKTDNFISVEADSYIRPSTTQELARDVVAEVARD